VNRFSRTGVRWLVRFGTVSRYYNREFSSGVAPNSEKQLGTNRLSLKVSGSRSSFDRSSGRPAVFLAGLMLALASRYMGETQR